MLGMLAGLLFVLSACDFVAPSNPIVEPTPNLQATVEAMVNQRLEAIEQADVVEVNVERKLAEKLTPTSVPTVTPSESVRNNKYGYSLIVPEGWSLIRESDDKWALSPNDRSAWFFIGGFPLTTSIVEFHSRTSLEVMHHYITTSDISAVSIKPTASETVSGIETLTAEFSGQHEGVSVIGVVRSFVSNGSHLSLLLVMTDLNSEGFPSAEVEAIQTSFFQSVQLGDTSGIATTPMPTATPRLAPTAAPRPTATPEFGHINWIDLEIFSTGLPPMIPDWLRPFVIGPTDPYTASAILRGVLPGGPAPSGTVRSEPSRVWKGQELVLISPQTWCGFSPTQRLMVLETAVWLGSNINYWLDQQSGILAAWGQCPPAQSY